MPANIAVGKDILSYCTSCKLDLEHIIVAMQGDQAKKVECKTCKKTHAYRAPKGVTEAAPKKKRKARTKRAVKTVESEWEEVMKTNSSDPMPYNTKGKFSPGDKIAHKNFGEGVITRSIYPNKIEIIFKDDIRTLICGGSRA